MIKGVDFIGVGVGAIVFNDKGEIFLMKRGPKSRNEVGKWNIPGGAVDFFERREDAIKREVKEEFDMDIEIIDVLETIDHIIEEEKHHWITTTFIVKHKSGGPKIMEPHKCDEIKWSKPDEVDIDSLAISAQSNLRKYLENIKESEH